MYKEKRFISGRSSCTYICSGLGESGIRNIRVKPSCRRAGRCSHRMRHGGADGLSGLGQEEFLASAKELKNREK